MQAYKSLSSSALGLLLLSALGTTALAAPPTTQWPYPWIDKGSKIGVHGIYSNPCCGTDYYIPDFAQTLVDGGAQFPIVKSVNDLWWLAEIKQVSPETITVGRLVSQWEAAFQVELPETNLDTLADNIMGVIAQRIQSEPEVLDYIDYWEVINEPDPPDPGSERGEGYRRLAELMIKCIERANAMGIKIAIFSLNAGTPEWWEITAMVETGVFGHARDGGHIFAVHEGVFDDLDGDGVPDPIDLWFGDLIPESPVVAGAGALCFRYRYIYYLLEQRGEVVPLLVSEFYAGGGYEGTQTPDGVVDRMAWYDAEAANDYYMLGFQPFTLGPSPGWEGADYGFAYPALINYMISIADRENGQAPGEPFIDAGVDQDAGSDGATDPGADAGAGTDGEGYGGCSCQASGTAPTLPLVLWLFVLGLAIRSRLTGLSPID